MQLKTRDVFGSYPKWWKRPYGVRIEFDASGSEFVGENADLPSFLGIWNEACVILSEDLIFHFERDRAASSQEGSNIWNVFIEGFKSASEAEVAGCKFAYALMQMSVMIGPSLQIRYSQPKPCEVYSRRLPRKPEIRAFLSDSFRTSKGQHQKRVDVLRDTWANVSEGSVDDRVFLALELYCSARFETSERARFLGKISSVEVLAIQQDYSEDPNFGQEIEALIPKLVREANQLKSVSEPIKESLKGRIRNLKRESVRRACRNLIESRLPDMEDASSIFSRAYKVRSRIIHDGDTPEELASVEFEVDGVIRRLLTSYLER